MNQLPEGVIPEGVIPAGVEIVGEAVVGTGEEPGALVSGGRGVAVLVEVDGLPFLHSTVSFQRATLSKVSSPQPSLLQSRSPFQKFILLLLQTQEGVGSLLHLIPAEPARALEYISLMQVI